MQARLNARKSKGEGGMMGRTRALKRGHILKKKNARAGSLRFPDIAESALR